MLIKLSCSKLGNAEEKHICKFAIECYKFAITAFMPHLQDDKTAKVFKFATIMLYSLVTSMPMIVCAVMTAQIILELRRHDSIALRWLAAWAIVTTILYGCHFVYYNHAHLHLLVIADTIYTTCNLAVFPLYLIFINTLITLPPILSRKITWAGLAIPAICGIGIATLFGLMNEEEMRAFAEYYSQKRTMEELTGLVQAQAILHRICRLLFALEVAGVLTVIIKKMRRYNSLMDMFYADTEERKVKSGIWITLSVITMCIIAFLANIIGRSAFNNEIILAIPSISFSVILFGIAYSSLSFAVRLAEEELHDFSKDKDTDKQVPNSSTAEILKKLTALMDEEEAFLTKDLRLNDIAKRLQTNRTTLQQTLRDRIDMTFSEYINRQRISYALKLIKDNPKITKKELSFRSGYTTYSSFYRNYKLYTLRKHDDGSIIMKPTGKDCANQHP